MAKGIRNGTDSYALAYIHGRIEAQLEYYGKALNVSADWLAEGLSALLSAQGPGVQHYLPSMREAPSGNSGAVEPVALALHAHSGQPSLAITTQPGSPAPPDHQPLAPPKKTRAYANYWSKMTSEERAAEMARRLSTRKNLTPAQKKQLKTMKAHAKPVAAGKPNATDRIGRKKVDQSALQKAVWARKKALRSKSSKAVAAALDEKRRKDRERHRLAREAKKQSTKTPPSKQAVYRERHEAKAKGLPLPPLPSAQPSANTPQEDAAA